MIYILPCVLIFPLHELGARSHTVRPNTILSFVLKFMPVLQRPVSSDTLFSLGLYSACLVLCLVSLSL